MHLHTQRSDLLFLYSANYVYKSCLWGKVLNGVYVSAATPMNGRHCASVSPSVELDLTDTNLTKYFETWTDDAVVIQIKLNSDKWQFCKKKRNVTLTPSCRTSCPWRQPRRARRPTAAGRSAPTGCSTDRCCRCGAIPWACRTQIPSNA